MNLLTWPNPLLTHQAAKFDFNDPKIDPIQLEKNMLECMYIHRGIGLAATQIGIDARVFVMGSSDAMDRGQAYFNPEILDHVDDLDDTIEGCLSFPGIFVKIKRPYKIRARWQNSSGEFQEGIFEGYDCKCFLHELDHLEGITMKHRVSSLKWNMAVNKMKRNKI